MSAIDASLRIWKLVRDELKKELGDVLSLSPKQRLHLQDELMMCEEQVQLYERKVKVEA